MSVEAILTILAIVLGPIVAVQTAQFLEGKKERKRRKFELFRALMQTRGIRLDPMHVAALNVIELEFYNDAKVRDSFQKYIEHLSSPMPAVDEQDKYFEARSDLFMNLLHEIGSVVGYKFDKRELERRSYVPQGWDNDQMMQKQNARLISQLLSGERALPITSIVNSKGPFPPPPDMKG